MIFDEGAGLSTESQQYDPTPVINEIRRLVDQWRTIPDANNWRVTPETSRLLQHWRHHDFQGIRPFFCQVEAVETAIWLTEVAPKIGKTGQRFLDHIAGANEQSNPELMRIALKLATGAGKTTVMAMLIAWQTINAVRRPGSKRFTRGFLVVTPGITIGDRLRVLQPNDPDSYYESRELVPHDMLGDLERAKIVITNFHAFKLRERMELSSGGRALLQGRGEPLNTLETEGQMLITALEVLYGHFDKTFQLWQKAGIKVPPCFIVVCNNTSTSKLVHDYIAGFQRENDDGSTTLVHGRLELFRNYDEHGNRLARPRTLLIDSEQLESGDALDKNFREMASDEIERFRREIVERTGDVRAAEEIDDATLLREVMNTVGKSGRLGEDIRCVVSVGMLTEGWDANTVTHVLGVRAFGTQLLCEQVIGRALRRQSYDLNEDDRFNVEYADVLGIPFDFNAKPVVAPPQPPRKTIQVKAVRPDRDDLEIRFPKVDGYRVELPEERLEAEFNDDSILQLTPELIGATKTQNAGIIGQQIDLDLVHTGNVRPSQVLYELTSDLVLTHWRDPGDDPKLYLFGQLKRIARRWLNDCLKSKGGTYPAQLKYKMIADMACKRITDGITRHFAGDNPIKAVLDPYNPVGSTNFVNFNTSKTDRWDTIGPPPKCHVNWIILDSDWEAEFCRVAETHPRVKRYVKNHNLGLEVPYRYGSEMRRYRPDFIVQVDDGHGDEDLLNLIVEIKGYRREDAKEKKATMETCWVPGVNHLGPYGRWSFAEFTDVYEIETDFKKKVESEFNKMIEPLINANERLSITQ